MSGLLRHKTGLALEILLLASATFIHHQRDNSSPTSSAGSKTASLPIDIPGLPTLEEPVYFTCIFLYVYSLYFYNICG